PSVFTLFSGRTQVNLVEDDGPDDEHGKDPAADEDRDERPEGFARHARDDDDHGYSDGDCGKDSERESAGAVRIPVGQARPPATWTILAFPRPTRISAMVFGRVTTSSFLRRYVVSIPANGGRSSSTCTRTWSFSVGVTGARFVSSARTTRIRSGSFEVAGPLGRWDSGDGVASAACGRGPNASARDFFRRATMFSNNADSCVVRWGTSTSAPLARLEARRASFRSRYVKIWSLRFRTLRSSSWRSRAFGEFGSFWASAFAPSSRRATYAASLS